MAVKLKFLGGLGDIGRNCMAIEDDGEVLIVDAGLYFPELRAFGIDIALPDFSALEGMTDRVVGIVLTHGHEDHIGALGELSKLVSAPIYGSRVTLAIAAKRLDEGGAKNEVHEVSDYETKEIGKFRVTFYPVAHSVPDSCALAIETSEGVIYHSGDFKLDPTPLDARTTDLKPLRDLGAQGQVSLLLIDATNAEEPGWTESELAVRPAIHSVFESSAGRRIICTCFASHIHRVSQLIQEARTAGRKVAPAGRSMVRIFEIIDQLGLMNLAPGDLIDIRDVDKYEPGEICVLSTGGQGEPRAALALMARGEHHHIKLVPGDVVLMSSGAIPGNESEVGHLIDQLVRSGAEVIHDGMLKVHVSGHAKRDELREVLRQAQPKAVLPIHGEYRHMVAVRRLVEAELPEASVLVVEDGSEVSLSPDGLSVSGQFPAPYIYRSNARGPVVSNRVIRERRNLQSGGVLFFFLVLLETGSMNVAADQVGWLNAALFDEHLDQLTTEFLSLAAGARDRGLSGDELENHLEARMRRFTRRVSPNTPHVVVIVESASNDD
jgi:ribonuclease J